MYTQIMQTQNIKDVCLLFTTIFSVLVMDMEILILLCWIFFVGLAYKYGSNVINTIFEKRRDNLHKDMAFSLDYRENMIKSFLHYHIIQTKLFDEIEKIFTFSKLELIKILIRRQSSFNSIVSSQIENKLFILADKEAFVAGQVQDNINQTICNKLHFLFKTRSKRVVVLKKKILSETMKKFKNIA